MGEDTYPKCAQKITLQAALGIIFGLDAVVADTHGLDVREINPSFSEESFL